MRERNVGKILVIDLGTSYFKTALFDRGGRLCHVCRLATPVRDAPAGCVEVTAEDFGEAIVRGIAEVRDRAGGLSDVEAVTFATQTNSFLLLDAGGHALTPIILWPDQRAAGLETEVRARCDVPGFSATTGIPQVNFQFMAAKLLWLRQRSAEVCSRASKVCLISDYLTFLLTGRYVTEAGAAGLTGLVDVHRCRWWPDVLVQFGLSEGHLPRVVRAGTDLGSIGTRAAHRFELPKSCRLVVGCLDQYAGAIGAGNVKPGMFSETTGTVLATVRCADRFSTQLGPDVFQGPAFREGLYWRMAFGNVSANYLEWYRQRLPDRPDFNQLVARAEQAEPGSDGLRLRTDVGLTEPEQVFLGLMPRHTPAHAVRCILEAVAGALAGQVAALSDGPPAGVIHCAGGAAQSDLWLQIKADVLGMTVAAMQCPEPTSLGAAVLAEAALAAADVGQVARQWVDLKPPHVPDPERHRQYQALT